MKTCLSSGAKEPYYPHLGQSEIVRSIYENEEFSHYFKLVLNEIIKDCTRFREVYRTNIQYAEIAGCCEKTVQRIINLAVEFGMLHRKTYFDQMKRKRFRKIRIKWRALRRKLRLKPPVQRKLNQCPYNTPSESQGDGYADSPPKLNRYSDPDRDYLKPRNAPAGYEGAFDWLGDRT